MEYSLEGFVNRLREIIGNNFPYEDDDINKLKHKGRTGHIVDVAFKNNPVVLQDEMAVFDIGNDFAEANYPYYHILQDTEVIHIKNKGTKRSKGSQSLISDKGARDYGIVNWNGKTFTREYQKNVRGSRSKVEKARDKRFMGATVIDGKVYYTIKNANSNYYYNVHYHYIDKILENNVVLLASEFGMTMKATRNTSLGDDYSFQQQSDTVPISALNILDILSSFEGE